MSGIASEHSKRAVGSIDPAKLTRRPL
jgi:hypothetical protein